MKKETKKRGYRKGYYNYLYLLAGKRLPSETETGGIRDGDISLGFVNGNFTNTTIGNGDLMNKGLRRNIVKLLLSLSLQPLKLRPDEEGIETPIEQEEHSNYFLIGNGDLMNKGLRRFLLYGFFQLFKLSETETGGIRDGDESILIV